MRCPFCEIPCENEHCAYIDEDEKKEREIRRLEKENSMLKQTVKDLQKFIKKTNSK
jgi:uncharacterized protein YlxW (UPF0749 family)